MRRVIAERAVARRPLLSQELRRLIKVQLTSSEQSYAPTSFFPDTPKMFSISECEDPQLHPMPPHPSLAIGCRKVGGWMNTSRHISRLWQPWHIWNQEKSVTQSDAKAVPIPAHRGALLLPGSRWQLASPTTYVFSQLCLDGNLIRTRSVGSEGARGYLPGMRSPGGSRRGQQTQGCSPKHL